MKINIDVEQSLFDGQIRIELDNNIIKSVGYTYSKSDAIEFIKNEVSDMLEGLVE